MVNRSSNQHMTEKDSNHQDNWYTGLRRRHVVLYREVSGKR